MFQPILKKLAILKLEENSGCLGYKGWTDWGYDYDCEYEFAGDCTCDYCMHCRNAYGYIDPEKDPKNLTLTDKTLKFIRKKANHALIREED